LKAAGIRPPALEEHMEKLHWIKVKVVGDKLDVHDGKLKVDHGGDPIVIVWSFDRNQDAEVEFEATDFFRWHQAPPPNVFSEPLRSADGKRILIDDCHLGEASKSPSEDGWIYVLRAFNTRTGEKYETEVRFRVVEPSGTTPTNPAIINK
jgi:hypothetical protein